MTKRMIALITHCLFTIVGTANASVTISPGLGGDDTSRIQHAIDSSSGGVHFEAGLYKLNGALYLRPNRTYTGEGSWDPRYGSVLMQQKSGEPVFSVEGQIGSVTIVGLTLDGAPGSNAKGVAAGNPNALLANSTLRENYFLTGLSEGIDTPMVSSRIERNQFGLNGSGTAVTRRHIHSVYPGQTIGTNANWIVGNQFSSATGTEALRFEQGVQLHISGNRFEGNDSDTILQVNGMMQVVIEGNYFEGNKGDALMHFGNVRHSQYGAGNYIVRLQNNFYNMQRCNDLSCTPVYNNFVFKLDPDVDTPSVKPRASVTTVYMGYETGTHFTHSDGTQADLTEQRTADACSLAHMGIYLAINGPFYIPDYKGAQTNGCR